MFSDFKINCVKKYWKQVLDMSGYFVSPEKWEPYYKPLTFVLNGRSQILVVGGGHFENITQSGALRS